MKPPEIRPHATVSVLEITLPFSSMESAANVWQSAVAEWRPTSYELLTTKAFRRHLAKPSTSRFSADTPCSRPLV